MRTAAFIIALAIAALGVVGAIAPSGLIWIARHAVTPGAFYLIAGVRVAFALLLIAAAPQSRAPKTLRVVGILVLIAGVATAVIGAVAIDRAAEMVDWWLGLGTAATLATAAGIAALGGLLAYALSSGRRRS